MTSGGLGLKGERECLRGWKLVHLYIFIYIHLCQWGLFNGGVRGIFIQIQYCKNEKVSGW